SVDQQNWSVLGNAITTTSYSDTTASFGVHYYYRLLAQDDAGNASDFVFADVETPAFTNNVTSGNDTTYQSDDGLATVNVPNGALSGDANCGVAANSQT